MVKEVKRDSWLNFSKKLLRISYVHSFKYLTPHNENLRKGTWHMELLPDRMNVWTSFSLLKGMKSIYGKKKTKTKPQRAQDKSDSTLSEF